MYTLCEVIDICNKNKLSDSFRGFHTFDQDQL